MFADSFLHVLAAAGARRIYRIVAVLNGSADKIVDLARMNLWL